MPLPVQNHPQYELTLPSNDKVVKFRPFIMKEEKVLMMALESHEEIKMLEAIHNIVSACTNGAIDTKTSPLFDVQFAFLQVRSKSVGEVSDFVVKCGHCDATIPTAIDISKIKVDRIEGHTRTIFLTPTTGVVMRYPTLAHLNTLATYTKTEQIYTVIAECIESIFNDEESIAANTEDPAELLEWIDNLEVSHFNKIREFFKTMPVLRHEHKFPCPKCKTDNILTLEGIESFFV